MVCRDCVGDVCSVCQGKKTIYKLVMSIVPLAEEDKPTEPCYACKATGRIKNHEACISKNGKDSTHCDCQHRADASESAVLHTG